METEDLDIQWPAPSLKVTGVHIEHSCGTGKSMENKAMRGKLIYNLKGVIPVVCSLYVSQSQLAMYNHIEVKQNL